MLTIVHTGDTNSDISYQYTTSNPIKPGTTETAMAFLNELTMVIDKLLRATEDKITGMEAESAWDAIINNIMLLRGKGNRNGKKAIAEDRAANFAYFTTYADMIIPNIIREIHQKYGKEYLVSCLTTGDLISSAKEEKISSAWLYMNAKEENDEDRMFACAKRLIAAYTNQRLVETMKEI